MNVNYAKLVIDGYIVDVDEEMLQGLVINYMLETAENFQQKRGSGTFSFHIPASPTNSIIYNNFYNPDYIDYTPNNEVENYRPFYVEANGDVIFRGNCLLTAGGSSVTPLYYDLETWGLTGEWVRNAQNLTLWDCVNPNPHTFNAATIVDSWANFGTDEAHDFVYAPVRYRQPWGTNFNTGVPNNVITPYHLRPSLSIYWILIRGFRQLGFAVQSDFMNDSDYFKRMVMPWVWGDFFDINNTLSETVQFKATGYSVKLDNSLMNSNNAQYYSHEDEPDTSHWGVAMGNSGQPSVIKSFVDSIGPGHHQNFRITNESVPQGFDNSGTYSFNETNGYMRWTYQPNPSLVNYFSSLGPQRPMFRLNLLNIIDATGGGHISVYINYSVNGGATTTFQILRCDSPNIYNYLVNPYTYDFYIAQNMSITDYVDIWLSWDGAGTHATLQVLSSIWVNNNFIGNINGNATATTASIERFNSNAQTNQTATNWRLAQTTLEMTGFYLQLGQEVNLQSYDKFRSYQWLDLLEGVIQMFNLSIQTDPINKIVVIEPTHEYKRTNQDTTPLQGYFGNEKYYEWTDKVDTLKNRETQLYSNNDRLMDFQFAGDGNDGGINVHMNRYKSFYPVNNAVSIAEKGLIKGMKTINPGSARFVFSPRFEKDIKVVQNKFFSPLMHYVATEFSDMFGTPVAPPQIPVIIPENINSTSSGFDETFNPKIAFYAGQNYLGLDNGGFYWHPNYDPGNLINPVTNSPNPGDLLYPQLPQNPADMTSITWEQIPLMFSVFYGSSGFKMPILTYCDQYINNVRANGLIRNFYLRRLSWMKQGKLYKVPMYLNNRDVMNWMHRESIRIDKSSFWLIGIEGYKPFSDESTVITFWKDKNPDQSDSDSVYPSYTSIKEIPAILNDPFDLRAAPLLLFQSDIPTF